MLIQSLLGLAEVLNLTQLSSLHPKIVQVPLMPKGTLTHIQNAKISSGNTIFT